MIIMSFDLETIVMCGFRPSDPILYEEDMGRCDVELTREIPNEWQLDQTARRYAGCLSARPVDIRYTKERDRGHETPC